MLLTTHDRTNDKTVDDINTLTITILPSPPLLPLPPDINHHCCCHCHWWLSTLPSVAIANTNHHHLVIATMATTIAITFSVATTVTMITSLPVFPQLSLSLLPLLLVSYCSVSSERLVSEKNDHHCTIIGNRILDNMVATNMTSSGLCLHRRGSVTSA